MASREATTTKVLRYVFSTDENTKNAQSLARQNRALEEAQLKRKEIVSSLKADEDRITGDIKKLSRFVTDGHDYREIECKVLFDSPRDGIKTIVRLDTGEEVEQLAMETHERQMTLDLRRQEEERLDQADDGVPQDGDWVSVD